MNKSIKQQKGVSLLEGLIAIAIFSIGMLGIAAFQMKSMQANDQARFRAIASMYAEELIGLASTDYANAADYVTSGSPVSCTKAACQRWLSNLAKLPSGTATVTYDSTKANATYGQMKVIITWKAEKSESDTSTNSYTAVANLRAIQSISDES